MSIFRKTKVRNQLNKILKRTKMKRDKIRKKELCFKDLYNTEIEILKKGCSVFVFFFYSCLIYY